MGVIYNAHVDWRVRNNHWQWLSEPMTPHFARTVGISHHCLQRSSVSYYTHRLVIRLNSLSSRSYKFMDRAGDQFVARVPWVGDHYLKYRSDDADIIKIEWADY